MATEAAQRDAEPWTPAWIEARSREWARSVGAQAPLHGMRMDVTEKQLASAFVQIWKQALDYGWPWEEANAVCAAYVTEHSTYTGIEARS